MRWSETPQTFTRPSGRRDFGSVLFSLVAQGSHWETASEIISAVNEAI
jgi:phage baseplate assembly protein W